MKLSALIAPLIAAHAPHDQIMAVVMAFEAQQDDALAKRRTADAERQSRKRSRDVTLRHSDRSLTGDRAAPAEDKPLDTDKQNSKKNTTAADLAAFKAVLASLDTDRIDGLIAIRRKKRAPITGYAARLFVGDIEKCKLSLTEGADICIRRNWLTIEPEWLTGANARGSPQKPMNVAQLAHSRAKEGFQNAQPQPERHDLVALGFIPAVSERGR